MNTGSTNGIIKELTFTNRVSQKSVRKKTVASLAQAFFACVFKPYL